MVGGSRGKGSPGWSELSPVTGMEGGCWTERRLTARGGYTLRCYLRRLRADDPFLNPVTRSPQFPSSSAFSFSLVSVLLRSAVVVVFSFLPYPVHGRVGGSFAFPLSTVATISALVPSVAAWLTAAAAAAAARSICPTLWAVGSAAPAENSYAATFCRSRSLSRTVDPIPSIARPYDPVAARREDAQFRSKDDSKRKVER